MRTCEHGTSKMLFCRECYTELGGVPEDGPEEYEARVGLDITQQDLWDMQDALRSTMSAIQDLNIRFTQEKKNPLPFPGEG